MSERWVKRCERILEQIKALDTAKERDRLDLVHSMRLGLGALWGSLEGWMRWINSPRIMTQFTQEELKKMNSAIMDFAKSFIEYDIKMTKQGINKGTSESSERRPSRERAVPERFYV